MKMSTMFRASLAGIAVTTLLLASPLMAKDIETTADGLNRVDHSQMAKAWLKPGVDFSRYTKIMVKPVVVSFKNRVEYPLSAEQQQKLRDTVEKAFTKELGKRFELTQTPGSDVLLLQGALADVESYIPPDPSIGRSAVILKRLGQATLVAELRDSMSGEALARTVDRRELSYAFPQKSDSVFNLGEVEDAARDWARLVSRRLGDVQKK
jgi:Protein of unknown function (DUF3313)